MPSAPMLLLPQLRTNVTPWTVMFPTPVLAKYMLRPKPPPSMAICELVTPGSFSMVRLLDLPVLT